MAKKEKLIPFALRLEANTKKKAEKKATENNRSLNGHIVNLIEQDLKEVK